MKKIIFGLVIMGLTLSFNMARANEGYDEALADSSEYASEFGSCTVDPVYEQEFTGQAVMGSRVRNIACMDGSSVVATITSGAKVKVIAKTDGWYRVELSDGTKGWVGQQLLKQVDGSADVIKATTESTSSDLKTKVKGYILLEVEKNGEAYYVNDSGFRFYMKDGDEAYNIMRDLGLGISNVNLSKLEKGDVTLKNKLKGKIVLAVEKNGEAYYISPKSLKMHYLKNGSEAYKVMRQEGLGISSANLSKITKKDLSQYKKEQKVVKTETATTNSSNGTIALSGSVNGDKVNLNWTMSNMTSAMGFKVVVANHENPVYPGDEYHYLSDAAARSDSWSLGNGTYYFRACEYLGGKCGVYSNNLKIEINN